MTGDARAAAATVERLLERLRTGPDPQAGALAEDLVRCLVQLYGAGLERIVALGGDALLRELAADPLVESLLLVHDLHPLDTTARVRRALAGVTGATVDDIDVDNGVVRVRMRGGHGCSARTAREAAETAIRDAAPEATGVEVELAAEPVPLLRIGRRPGA